MSIIKGYSEKFREVDQLTKDQYVTAEPIREKQIGSSVAAHVYVYEVGTDTVEASSTVQVLNLTAHSIKIGDILRFTSGALDSQEVKVLDVSTNTVTLAEKLASDPSALTIQILRYKYPVVSSSGDIAVSPGALIFTRDGSDQEVIEDTVTPSNNRPLPVKLTDVTGDINITAGDLNVSLSDANDSVRLGDGTTLVDVSLSNELQVKDDDSIALLTTIDADTSVIAVDTTSIDGKITACDTGSVVVSSSALPSGAATEASLSSVDGKITACNTGAVTVSASVLPSGAATEASSAIIASDTTSIDGKITACNTGAVTISAALPAGSNNIGDVDVVSSALPTGAATAANQASILAKLQGALSPVDFLDSGVVDSSSTNIPAAGLQVVASLASDCVELEIVEDIGEFITLTDGSDVVLAYLPLGGGRVKVSISAGTALKLASVSGATISVGKIAINFLG